LVIKRKIKSKPFEEGVVNAGKIVAKVQISNITMI